MRRGGALAAERGEAMGTPTMAIQKQSFFVLLVIPIPFIIILPSYDCHQRRLLNPTVGGKSNPPTVPLLPFRIGFHSTLIDQSWGSSRR